MVEVHPIAAGLGRAYLLAAPDGMVLVDAGSPRQERRILARMRALGRRDLRLILVTHAHFDHYGSAAAVRRLTGAPIAVHEADADSMARGETRLGSLRGWGRIGGRFLPLAERALRPAPTAADLTFRDGESLARFGLDAVVLHTPGHTPGSCTLWVERRLAFVGDLASGRWRPHVQRFYAQDWTRLAESLALVRDLRAEALYTGHGRRRLASLPGRGDRP